jgi:hypothetical protein
MGYVLGSQVESMTFTDAGAEYAPAGAAHAVASHSETYVPDAFSATWSAAPQSASGPTVLSI